MNGLFKLTYHLDSDKQVVEDFLRKSAYLKFGIGKLEKIQIKRIINYHGTKEEPPYKDYLFHLKGSNKSAIVDVRYYYDCNKEIDKCTSILSIE